MATLGGFPLGVIETEDQTKDSSLFFTPLPYSNSTDTILMDLMGTSRTITISGTFVESTKTALQTRVLAIEQIQNGQQGASAYVGDFITTSKNVLIQTFNWSWVKGDTQRIKYSLTLLEGSAI